MLSLHALKKTVQNKTHNNNNNENPKESYF